MRGSKLLLKCLICQGLSLLWLIADKYLLSEVNNEINLKKESAETDNLQMGSYLNKQKKVFFRKQLNFIMK